MTRIQQKAPPGPRPLQSPVAPEPRATPARHPPAGESVVISRPGRRFVNGASQVTRRRQGGAAVSLRAGEAAARAVPTPETHPQWFTPGGEKKWKVPPPGVTVIPNDTGTGDWIEKWLLPERQRTHPITGRTETLPPKWVHNYTEATMRAKAGEKFVKNRAFARVLPALRRQVRRDLLRGGERQVLALVVAMIDHAYFRVGNEDSDDRGSFGITTLQRQHVQVRGDRVCVDYIGKAFQEQHKLVVDAGVARIIRRLCVQCHGPGDRLFTVSGRPIEAGDVNRYLAEFGATAKQFRTYHATRLCFEALSRRGNVRADERAAVVTEVVKGVAAQLGHTAAVCEQYYIDRQVISSYLDGRLCGRREAT